LSFAPVRLNDQARRIVDTTLAAHCELKQWTTLARNVRSNHVHVVIAWCELPPERIMGQLKAWTTRRLREAGLFGPDQPVWSEGGSRRYLWDDAAVRSATDYVANYQGEDLIWP